MSINIFYNFLKKRHFWRYATFSEIAELYVSRTLRVVAIYVAGGFTTVFLYKQGYSLSFILICWACFYLVKALFIYLSSFFVADFGPKHGTLISNLLYIPAMLAVGLVPNIGLPGVIIWAFFAAISTAFYQLSYLVDFSKVKNVEHAGKEMAFMNIFEKAAIGLSPVVGGLIALWFSPQILMLVSAIFFMFASMPLLKTSEPVKTKQRLNYKEFPWKMARRSLIAQTGTGFDAVATTVIWGLFIVIALLPNVGNEIYVDLGILSSVTILAAVAASYAFGKLIDKSRGGYLLKYGVIANAIIHLSRPFAVSPVSIIGVNVTNEIATTGYNMAFMRGMFDTADFSGHRIVYLSASSIISTIGASLACLACLVCVAILGDIDGMKVFFFVSACTVLIIGTADYKLYRK